MNLLPPYEKTALKINKTSNKIKQIIGLQHKFAQSTYFKNHGNQESVKIAFYEWKLKVLHFRKF